MEHFSKEDCIVPAQVGCLAKDPIVPGSSTAAVHNLGDEDCECDQASLNCQVRRYKTQIDANLIGAQTRSKKAATVAIRPLAELGILALFSRQC
jgi:hypothetical protein